MKVKPILISVLSALILLILPLCKNKESAPAGFKRITIQDEDFRLQDTLSNYLKIEKIVRLETHPDALMGIITRIEVVDNLIFVLKQDRSQELLVFSMEGKFIRKLCRKGKGPGEATLLLNFYVDSTQKQVYLTDLAKVIRLDYEGNLISELKFDSGIGALVTLDENHLIISAEGKNQVLIADLNGNVVNRFMTFDPFFQSVMRFQLIKTGDRVLYHRFMDDTLYQVSRDTVVPCYLIDFGERALTRKQYLQFPANSMGDRKVDSQYMHGLGIKGNAGAVVAFYFQYDEKQFFTFTDLNLNQTRIFDYGQVQKDPLLGKGFFTSASSNPDHFIGYYLPGAMDTENIPKVLTSKGPVSMDDNPILVFYRFDFGGGIRKSPLG